MELLTNEIIKEQKRIIEEMIKKQKKERLDFLASRYVKIEEDIKNDNFNKKGILKHHFNCYWYTKEEVIVIFNKLKEDYSLNYNFEIKESFLREERKIIVRKK